MDVPWIAGVPPWVHAYAAGIITGLVGLLAVMLFNAVTATAPQRPKSRDLAADAASIGAAFAKHADMAAARLAHILRLKTVSYDRVRTAGATPRVPACAVHHSHPSTAPTHDVTTEAVSTRRTRASSKSPARHKSVSRSAPAAEAAPSQPDDQYAAARVESGHAFLALHDYLKEQYPRMHAACERVAINTYSAVYVWRGSDVHAQAVALYAHTDVVPADDGHLWTVPPFSGELRDGHVWGRGAIDDKQAVIGICEALEFLATSGFRPRRTIVVMFGHDEEIGGEEGAQHCAAWVERNVLITDRATGARVKPIGVLLDEGLFVLEGVVPGHAKRTAMICSAEKGYVNVYMNVNVTGGHASTPPRDTAIGILSRAIARLEASPFPTHFDAGPVVAMFAALLPGLTFPLRFAFANLWLTRPLVAWALSQNPRTATLVRTTTAPTIVRAGTKANTLPSSAEAVINHRIHPSENVAFVLQRDAAVIGDPRVELSTRDAVEPSPVSDHTSPAFAVIANTVEALYINTVAAPALMPGATDSHWSEGITDNTFRHCPTELKAHEVSMFHGVDERISVQNLGRICAFYTCVIRAWDAAPKL